MLTERGVPPIPRQRSVADLEHYIEDTQYANRARWRQVICIDILFPRVGTDQALADRACLVNGVLTNIRTYARTAGAGAITLDVQVRGVGSLLAAPFSLTTTTLSERSPTQNYYINAGARFRVDVGGLVADWAGITIELVVEAR